MAIRITVTASLMATMIAMAVGVSVATISTNAAGQVAATGTAPAASPISLYRAYEAALDAGNYAGAADLGLQAWQAARDRFPDSNPNKAALAYNAAWVLTIMGRYGEVVEPAAAAVALSGNASGTYDPGFARFLEAAARYKTTRPLATDEQNRLTGVIRDFARTMIDSPDLDVAVPVALTASAWAAVANRDFADVYTLSDLALKAFEKLEVRQGQPVADAYLARSVSYASTFERLSSPASLRNATMDAVRARQAFGTVPLNAPRTYYAAQAWAAAVRAVAVTADQENRLPDLDDIAIPQPGGLECELLERVRGFGREIVYPPTLRDDGMAGGAVVLARLAADGSVESTEVGASIPNAQFGQNAADAIKTWKYTIPAGYPAACRENFRTTVIYVL